MPAGERYQRSITGRWLVLESLYNGLIKGRCTLRERRSSDSAVCVVVVLVTCYSLWIIGRF